MLTNLTMSSNSGEEHNLQLRYLDNVNDVSHTLPLPFVLLSGDTMTGALTLGGVGIGKNFILKNSNNKICFNNGYTATSGTQ
jgi:hypothetical protein